MSSDRRFFVDTKDFLYSAERSGGISSPLSEVDATTGRERVIPDCPVFSLRTRFRGANRPSLSPNGKSLLTSMSVFRLGSAN